MNGQAAARFPDRVRLPLAFDPGALAADLARLRDVAWTGHFVRQNYSGEWSVLPLRACAGETHPVRQIYSDPSATAWEDTPYLAHTPCFQAVLSAFHCPVRTARLMRLTPGSVIHEHEDLDLAAELGTARIHVAVTTNAAVEFLLNGTPVAIAAGETWYLRLSDRHAVANRGATDRVHLVIDLTVDDWLIGMLAG